MADHFAFNAPKFLDFEQLEDLEKIDKEQIEAYFDQDHENDIVNNYNGAIVKDSTEIAEYVHIEDTISDEEYGEAEEFLDATDNGYSSLRKSISMSCLSQDKQNNDMLSLFDKINAITLSPQEKSEQKTLDKLDIEKPKVRFCNFQKKTISADRLNILSQPKYASSGSINQEKFVSMAEAVSKFHTKTPIRFRETKGKGENSRVTGVSKCTIPQSPMLLSKRRQRPVEIISSEEREMLEYEEAKKQSFKAKPVNLKALEGSKIVPVEKKPTTEVKPFKLTEVPKKIHKSSENVYEFHAKPVPKAIYVPKEFIIKNHLITETRTPKFMKRYAEKLKKQCNKEKEEKKPCKAFPLPQRTVPVPFSFEKRDQQLLVKKEKMIQKVLEESNKGNDFHARPMPEKILKSPKIKPRLMRSQHGSMESLKSTKSDDGLSTTFKARPAKVLYTKPFFPKKEMPKLIEISEFRLNSQRRASEREKFDYYIKEKEALQMERIKELEEQKKMEEQAEIARIRKEAVRVAEPIRRYKDVKTVPSKPVTEPRTPNLSTTMRAHNKENICSY